MKISWRIAGDEVRYREVARSLADLIKENPESFDEIALFTDINEHCYEDLGAIKTLSDKIRREISAIRALGVRSVGINILNTIGQNDDGWDFVEHSPYQTMVGHDGTKTFGSNCMRAPGFREYMCKKYELYANTGADFLWVDDDMRISWHGALFPCFCDRCVSDFSARVDRKFDRVSLVKALDGDGELRREWMRYNADEMCEHVRVCADAARRVNPNIRLGLMTVGLDTHLYNLNNFEDMMKALGADMLRPGGGYWTAEVPEDYFSKCLSVAYQIELAPSGKDIQYESETIPHLESKPKRIHKMEMCAALMSGCNGIAVDDVRVSEPQYFREMAKLVKERKPFFDELTEALEGKRLRGGCAVVRNDACASVRSEVFFPSPAIDAFLNECKFFGAGFSFTACERDADYYVISSQSCDTLTDDELKLMLSRGVIMDGAAAKRLAERGFAELCGYASSGVYNNGLKTVYTRHPFNTAPLGMRRGGLQAEFRGGKSIFVITPRESAEILTECKSITEIPLGASDYIYENSLGGRIAVLGYAPWTNFEQRERVDMLRNIVKWVSGGVPSVAISGAYRVLPILRASEKRESFCLMLTNAWLDATRELTVELRSDYSGKIRVYDSSTNDFFSVTAEGADGICRITLPPLGAWDYFVLMSE